MRGASREVECQVAQIESVFCLEPYLSNAMLFRVVFGTQAYCPDVRGLQSHAAVRPPADVCAFDRPIHTSGDTAVMTSNPRSVRWAFPPDPELAAFLHSLRQPHVRFPPPRLD